MVAKKKSLTANQKVKLLTQTLEVLQKAKYHFPNSDYHEYCSCGHSPYNIPDHKPGCLTVLVAQTLAACATPTKPQRIRKPRKPVKCGCGDSFCHDCAGGGQ